MKACDACAVLRRAEVVTSAHELCVGPPSLAPTAGDVVALVSDPGDDDDGTFGADVDVAVVAVESIVARDAAGLVCSMHQIMTEAKLEKKR